jgi:hypothetical protein
MHEKETVMGVNKEEISKTTLALEKSFNERWSVGDNRGYLGNYAEEISYFDPIEEDLVVGRDATVAHIEAIYSDPHIRGPSPRASATWTTNGSGGPTCPTARHRPPGTGPFRPWPATR